ncbi:acyltransferase [Pseudoroseicyclus aestuarii]|uniref:Surface polysaccharide O-acyltransferase-like enzyme n=1 Tax=Pseudoroseicyclus aestuarii TaxID=1795041 RepID=A0A318SXB9_9RHOB|nr:acyltransferase [Pseudoroseicyclus aestuarii]PYE85995.1 surface polysaccharide O-acyltransferase-like enzyme [Pseudoroseicyclus aestuarii]
MAETERYVWLDALRLTAGVSMIGLHATADAAGQPFTDYAPSERIAPMLLRAVIYIARTELFIIIALFLLLMALDRRPRPYRRVVAEQARRLLVPFAFWTVFYAFYNLVKAQSFGFEEAILAQLTDPAAWLGHLLLGDVKYHMHFIPTLFGIILAYPLYRLSVQQPALGLVVIGALFFRRELDGVIYPAFWGTEALSWLVRLVKIASYIGYGMVAGAMLGFWRRSTPQQREALIPALLFAGGLLFMGKLAGTWMTVTRGEWPHGLQVAYWADYLMPVALFALCLCLGHRRWPAWISRLAPYSFGIYLCHPIFLDLAEIALRGTQMGPMAQVLTKIALALAGTALLVAALRRCRPLAWTIGLGKLPSLQARKRAPNPELT